MFFFFHSSHLYPLSFLLIHRMQTKTMCTSWLCNTKDSLKREKSIVWYTKNENAGWRKTVQGITASCFYSIDFCIYLLKNCRDFIQHCVYRQMLIYKKRLVRDRYQLFFLQTPFNAVWHLFKATYIEILVFCETNTRKKNMFIFYSKSLCLFSLSVFHRINNNKSII